MTLLGVTDPHTWTATDWGADLLPHLAYGAVTSAVGGARLFLPRLSECRRARRPD
jgi:hypothetical protein